MARELWKGNDAIAEAAIRAGLQAYFGYPITPQTELLEWMARRMPELGRTFVQAESELGAINMVYGAATTGVRVMTSSSGPGVSLMMEGLSYIASTEMPVVLVDMMRGGPGLGNIAPAQGDYTSIVRGGGHGDYNSIVLAPSSIQEAIDQTGLAFDLAEKYRSIVIILIDGSIGQMMEPAEMPPMQSIKTGYPDWAVRGMPDRQRRRVIPFRIHPRINETFNLRLLERWLEIEAREVRYRGYYLDDARFAVVGFGTAGRIALSAVREARAEGIPVGLVRPISLSPYPYKIIEELSKQLEAVLVVEMNNGMMLDDVLLATKHRLPVAFYGRPGGVVPMPEDILDEIRNLVHNTPIVDGHPRQRWFERMGELGLIGE